MFRDGNGGRPTGGGGAIMHSYHSQDAIEDGTWSCIAIRARFRFVIVQDIDGFARLLTHRKCGMRDKENTHTARAQGGLPKGEMPHSGSTSGPLNGLERGTTGTGCGPARASALQA